MNDEAKRAGETLAIGLVVGVLHLALISDRFREANGSGGLTMLIGLVFITGIVWTMLALRTIANDGPPGPEITDGLISMSVTTWVMAVVPPRTENFFAAGAADDFALVYVPLSLLAVFVVLAAQKLWPKREVKFVFVRLFASVALSAAVVGLLVVFVTQGSGAREVGWWSAGLTAVAALAAGFSSKWLR